MASKSVKRNVSQYVERTGRVPLTLESLAAIAIGIALLVSPKNASELVIALFGLYWLIHGIGWLLSLFRSHKEWGWRLVGGIASIIIGGLLITHSLWSAYLGSAVVIWAIAAAGFVIGIVMILQGFAYRLWGKVVLGFVTLGASFLLAVGAPAASLLVPWLVGIGAIVAGGYGLIAAIRKHSPA